MNIPYIKKYDKNGILINPIRISYINRDINRHNRKLALKNKKFSGKRIQIIKLKDEKGMYTGSERNIKHAN